MIQLVQHDGDLYTKESDIVDELLKELYKGDERVILLYRYDAGDCNTMKWPNYDADLLRCSLYDWREAGVIPRDCQAVTLPDGTEFRIDE